MLPQPRRNFFRLAQALSSKQFRSSISLDLSHIGLLISPALVRQNLSTICVAAAQANQEVIISMEGIDRTDAILDIYKDMLRQHANLGITIQAYLHRTKDDFKDIIQLPGSIRLVKGAYDVPTHAALPRGPELDRVYLNYAEQLLQSNHPCAIASHHDLIFREATQMIDQYKPTEYVLERLLGIGNEELDLYKNKGYRCRMYVVYGKEWYLYLCNRLAEYPLNLFRALADVVEN